MTPPAFATQTGSIKTVAELSIARTTPPGAPTLSKADAARPAQLRRIARAALTYWKLSELTETTELLLTELVTNAFRHGRGNDVGVRLYVVPNWCVLEVFDGSPECPALCRPQPDDENGRGLFLVDLLADQWGVSPNGTTTWCTLPLPQRTPPMPEALPAPVTSRYPLRIPADPSAAQAARIKGRTALTMLGWPGSHEEAVEVLGVLVTNALEHGTTPGVTRELYACLSVTETRELLIDAEDRVPEFPDFECAVAGELGKGLWRAKQLGATITWSTDDGFSSKTVRAVMRPSRVGL